MPLRKQLMHMQYFGETWCQKFGLAVFICIGTRDQYWYSGPVRCSASIPAESRCLQENSVITSGLSCDCFLHDPFQGND
jgi:hypothetical protein